MLFDPRRDGASDRHLHVSNTYQAVRTLNSFLAALAFVVGSALFFWESTQTTATVFFLVGSILFAVSPTLDVARQLHLRRLSGDEHQLEID